MNTQAGGPAAGPVASRPPVRVKHWFGPDNRYLAPVFITCILLACHLSFGILESYQKTVLAIVTSIAADTFDINPVLGTAIAQAWLATIRRL